MTQDLYLVAGVREVGENIFVIRFLAPDLAASIRAGQFLNIKVADGYDPLLRRPSVPIAPTTATSKSSSM